MDIKKPRGKESTKVWKTQKNMKRKWKLSLKKFLSFMQKFTYGKIFICRSDSENGCFAPTLVAIFQNSYLGHLYCVFTYIYSFLIEKDK